MIGIPSMTGSNGYASPQTISNVDVCDFLCWPHVHLVWKNLKVTHFNSCTLSPRSLGTVGVCYCELNIKINDAHGSTTLSMKEVQDLQFANPHLPTITKDIKLLIDAVTTDSAWQRTRSLF